MDIEDLTKKIAKIKKKILEDLPKNKPVMNLVGESMVDQIRKRTRKGFGVAANNSGKSGLNDLKDSTKDARKSAKAAGILSKATTPDKSNLTYTGDMLDNLTFKHIDEGVSVVPGSKFAKDKTDWNAKKGRKYLFLSKPEIKKITKLIERAIADLINKVL